jgi:hypothetical protein
MNSMKSFLAVGLCVSVLGRLAVFGQEPSGEWGKPWQYSLRMGGEFSDNRDGTATNKQNNLDGIVEPRAEFIWQDADRTRMQLMVMPQMRWHSHPRTAAEGSAQDSTELFGACGLELMHRLTPTLTLNAGDQFSYSDDPAKIETGTTSRRRESYVRNDAHAGVNAAVSAAAGANLTAGVVTMRYPDSDAARELDSDLYNVACSPYYNMGSGWMVLGNVGASEFQSEKTIRMRGSAMETCYAGVEKKVTQDFVWKVLGGYQFVQYDNPALKSDNMLGGNAEVVFMETAPTRFRLGVEYGYTPPSIGGYSAQQATTYSGAVDHDVLANRMTISLQGQYRDSQYLSEGADAPSGSEKMTRLGIHGTYFLNNKWSFTGGYFYENWESLLREPFQRNLITASVRAAW